MFENTRHHLCVENKDTSESGTIDIPVSSINAPQGEFASPCSDRNACVGSNLSGDEI